MATLCSRRTRRRPELTYLLSLLVTAGTVLCAFISPHLQTSNSSNSIVYDLDEATIARLLQNNNGNKQKENSGGSRNRIVFKEDNNSNNILYALNSSDIEVFMNRRCYVLEDLCFTSNNNRFFYKSSPPDTSNRRSRRSQPSLVWKTNFPKPFPQEIKVYAPNNNHHQEGQRHEVNSKESNPNDDDDDDNDSSSCMTASVPNHVIINVWYPHMMVEVKHKSSKT